MSSNDGDLGQVDDHGDAQTGEGILHAIDDWDEGLHALVARVGHGGDVIAGGRRLQGLDLGGPQLVDGLLFSVSNLLFLQSPPPPSFPSLFCEKEMADDDSRIHRVARCVPSKKPCFMHWP